jgi:hypothetical protein
VLGTPGGSFPLVFSSPYDLPAAAASAASSSPSLSPSSDRSYWVSQAVTMAGPVLRAFAERKLRATMPVESPVFDGRYGGRHHFSHLEALARTLVGVAPWLDATGLAPEEEALRAEHAALARAAIDAATDPASPDYVNFSYSFQPIVDGAFLAHALLRAPRALWADLDPRVRANLVAGLKATRSRKPHYNNWLLFAAMIEVALKQCGEADWDRMRVDYALRAHEGWYRGDGVYADGPEIHADYYNSFVIHPMLCDIIEAVRGEYPEWDALAPGIRKRGVRHAEVLERMISPEGTFPPLGRSLAYRCGALQQLAQAALQDRLPEGVTPAQVRGALTAVMRRSLDAPGTYTQGGWLAVGFAGAQPEIAEMYISTGSLYLAGAVFLPLGLPPSHSFWSGAPADWTAKRMWSGGRAPPDHALDHVAI